MTTLAAAQIDDIERRHPDVFHQPLVKRFAAPLGMICLALYTIYVWWFFSIGTVVANGNWNLAGNYLADWVSYEVRPDIEYESGDIEIKFPRFSPLGDDPHPDWIETRTGSVTVAADAPRNDPSKAASDGSFMSPASSATRTGDGEFSDMSSNSSATSTEIAVKKNVFEPQSVTETRNGITSAIVMYRGGTRLEVAADEVSVTRGGETLVLRIDRTNENVTPQGELPRWAVQKGEGLKVFTYFGFAGRAEVKWNEVKVYRRFLGWENFWFDTNSPFWGKSSPQVVALALSGERVDLDRANIAVMWDNIVNNAEWQHGDVWIKLLQTIVMAFVGTLFAVLIAFPLSFVAARNVTPNRFLNQVLKRVFDFLRSVDMLIWALFFTRAFGPGPLAGISAIFFTDAGTFGKLYSETLENIDDKQREGVRSVGASPAAVQRFGVVPQVLPVFISQALYFWESNTRSATIIGAVGAGGIGLKLWEAMRTNADWENVAYMVSLILVVVFVFDNISNALRSRLTGDT
ncbi:phosphonate ABC transporter, permease protein PhnE [Oricola cellulosilytica]|uniref:Phosphonate ABC transporter, permease protein PhnE n=1 Tax=Oricola cellulosilytica TaxID=1429082 RepID=A0A4R0PAP9_9HYPH|nr:phosphonate ABC transporter, permease protein PhnE [Oricola cellulosilytica]TCD13375.1 phosphonate ABC transporter, permease protein PhnE [Oricola cellulosilytica]